MAVLSTGCCRKEALDGSNRCLLHDPEVWAREPELVRKKVMEQIKRGNFDFESCHFPGINFDGIQGGRRFRKPANFQNSHFHGVATFVNLRFGKTTFEGATFYDYANFSGARFLNNASFRDTIFHRSANFSGVKFSKDGNFIDTTFDARANFSSASFLGYINFRGATFSEARFDDVGFSKNVWFLQATFSGKTYFSKARFFGTANFENVIFSRNVNFNATLFNHKANFKSTSFSKNANFIHARFDKDVDFHHARFSGHATFFSAKFLGWANFVNATFSEGILLNDINTDEVLFDFSDSSFRGPFSVNEGQWSRKSCRLKIEKVSLRRAIRNYYLLKKVFLAMGHYGLAGDLHYNEMACKRRFNSFKYVRKSFPSFSYRLKSICRKAPLNIVISASFMKKIREARVLRYALRRIWTSRRRYIPRHSRGFWKQLGDWLWMQFFYFTCGFGERPLRVVSLSAAIIIVFAMAYFPLMATGISPENVASALYLSLDRFVALGVIQGAVLPMSWRWLAYLETGLGLFMMSLFLVVFTRKMTRD